MKLISLVITPFALFFPSRSVPVNVGKLALISMIFATFFLFVSGYHFPGGAGHYPDWALAIVNGTTLPPSHAQREVGFPLLYILSGFTFTHSFIGITLIFALFSVLIVLAVHWSLVRASPTVAFYMGLLCIVTLSPFTYIKFFYPDQSYMFFNLLAVTFLIAFFWNGRFQMLYFFTLAAVAASFTRTAGNLMYPVLLTIAYLTVRGKFRHYVACAFIFAAATGAYQWHRYEVFDIRHQATPPSGKGMQILYSTYLYLGDYGLRLSPDYGPNTKHLLDRIREELKPTVRESPLIRQQVGESPPEFMEKYFYAYTPEELIEKISTEPNEEYYWNVIYAIDQKNDQFLLDVAKEIMKAHPWYVVQYSMRNLWHALFDPGYATTRYNTVGYTKTGNDFIPATQGWGVISQDPVIQYGARAAREMEYFPINNWPRIQNAVSVLENKWVRHYDKYVRTTAALIIIAWIAAALGMLCMIFPRPYCKALMQPEVKNLMAPIIAASALLVYEDLATSMFSQPVYRYFHMTEPLRLVISGFGLILATRMISFVWRTRIAWPSLILAQSRKERFLSFVKNHDLLDGYFSPRPVQWVLLLVALNVALFGWWTSDILAKTGSAASFAQYKETLVSPINIISATFGRSCRDFVPPAPSTNWTKDGNVTDLVKAACQASNVKDNRCTVRIADKNWGDPAQGCGKDFSVTYQCQGGGPPRTATVVAEASGKTVELDCN